MALASLSERRDLPDLGALAEFPVRSGQSGAAVVATERLAAGLFAYYRRFLGNVPDRAPLRRAAIQLWSEVRLFGSRLRTGPVRHAPSLPGKVEALLMSEL